MIVKEVVANDLNVEVHSGVAIVAWGYFLTQVCQFAFCFYRFAWQKRRVPTHFIVPEYWAVPSSETVKSYLAQIRDKTHVISAKAKLWPMQFRGPVENKKNDLSG